MSTKSVAALQAEVDRLKADLQSMKEEERSEPISIGNYILARLAQLGVNVSLMRSATLCRSLMLRCTSLCLVYLVTLTSVFW
jgi:hypothetical protein